MKKVLILTTGSYLFGTEKVILQIIQGLKSKFTFHCLVSGWNDGKFILELNKLNVNYTEHKLGWYYKTKLLWTLDSLVHLPYAIYQFFRLRSRYDVFYTSTFRNVVLLYPWLNKPIIYHVHEFNMYSRLNRMFIRIADSKIDKYIAVSESIKIDLLKIGINTSKILVVYNGVKEFTNNKEEVKKNSVVIGIVGQISKHKGHVNMLKVFQFLYSKNKNIKLKIVGDGDLNFISELKNIEQKYQLEKSVIWSKYITDINTIYSDIDILCVPTLHPEPFGLVSCEAGIYGIPVIASKLGGLSEIVIDNHTGFLINPSDIPEFAEKLNLLINDQHLRVNFGVNAKIHITENFHQNRFLTLMEENLLKLL